MNRLMITTIFLLLFISCEEKTNPLHDLHGAWNIEKFERFDLQLDKTYKLNYQSDTAGFFYLYDNLSDSLNDFYYGGFIENNQSSFFQDLQSISRRSNAYCYWFAPAESNIILWDYNRSFQKIEFIFDVIKHSNKSIELNYSSNDLNVKEKYLLERMND
ncbi:hypothetical protein ACFLSA_01395 [Bacteroidota bacterium]